MDDSVFEEVMGQTFGAPSDPGEGDSTATAVMDPETAGWVTEEPTALAPDGEEFAVADNTAADQETNAPEGDAYQMAERLVYGVLESDANPYKKQAAEAQQRIDQSLQFLELQRAQQQKAAMDAAFRQRVARLPDLDPETQAMEVQRLVAEREAMAARQYQQQLREKEQQAESLARNQVIGMLAQRHGLNETEIQTMSALDDPYRMEQFAMMAVTNRQQAMGEVEQLRARLAELEASTAARQRMASGADRVGSGQATSARSRSPQPRNFDEFWETWVNQG